MRILAIDPATNTGFAISAEPPAPGVQILSGTWRLAVKRSPHVGARLLRLGELIRAAIRSHAIEKIGFEDSSMFTQVGKSTLESFRLRIQLRGVILLVAAEFDLPVYSIAPSTLKSWATGYGAADKGQMMRACRTFFGIDPQTDDEADAVMILAACWQDVQPKTPGKRAAKAKRAKARKEMRLFG